MLAFLSHFFSDFQLIIRLYPEAEPVFVPPDEIEDPDKYIEGVKKRITVNSDERDSSARNRCIEIHGLNCAVYDMNFEDVYGSIGIGYIHVHHKKPVYGELLFKLQSVAETSSGNVPANGNN